MRVTDLLSAVVVVWAMTGPAAMADDTAVRIDLSSIGQGVQTLTAADLAKMAATEVDVAFKTPSGEEKGRFRGVLVWTLLSDALAKLQGHNADLKHGFVVTGRDGYAIPFSVGEIAPAFGNTPIILAGSKDGKPLPSDDGLRLIVPGDQRGARNVKGVASIEVR